MRAFFLFILIYFFPCETAEIKAIMLCDIRAKHIEKSVASDLKNVEAALKKISSKSGISLSVKTFSNEYLKEPFLSHIASLNIEKDDIIFFYFSGHGFRTESKKDNPWSNLYLSRDQEAIDFKEIVHTLQEKKPKLLIAFSDCCNNVLPEDNAPPLYKIHAHKGQIFISAEASNYKRLFHKTKGSILISGAAPGEFSWCTKNGGLFTLAFFQSLEDEAKFPRPAEWQYILDRAALKIVKKELGQTPQFVLDIVED